MYLTTKLVQCDGDYSKLEVDLQDTLKIIAKARNKSTFGNDWMGALDD